MPLGGSVLYCSVTFQPSYKLGWFLFSLDTSIYFWVPDEYPKILVLEFRI